jgi:hypothetical protein
MCERRATDRPFTLVMCTRCDPTKQWQMLDELHAAVRRCPHGVLVSVACLLGALTCAAHANGPGAFLVLQPCSAERTPTAPAQWIGPISNRDDVRKIGAWLERGEWSIATLPRRLQSPRSWTS